MLWFEDETTVSAASIWVLEANAAAALVTEKGPPPIAPRATDQANTRPNHVRAKPLVKGALGILFDERNR